MGTRVVAVDIGSIGPPSKFAWVAFDAPGSELVKDGADPESAVSAPMPDLIVGAQAVLLLEAPMSVPVPAGPAQREAPLIPGNHFSHIDDLFSFCFYPVARVQAGHFTREMPLLPLKGTASNSSCFTIRLPSPDRTPGGVTYSVRASESLVSCEIDH